MAAVTARQPQGNLGIVAGFAASTATTYVDGGGRTVAAIAATSSYQAGQFAPSVGVDDRLLFTVHAAFTGGMTTWTFYARLNYVDPQGNSFWKPAEIAIQRADGSDLPGIAKALTSAAFTGADGAACDVAFVTTNAFASCGTLEIMVKGNQAALTTDAFYLTVEAGK